MHNVLVPVSPANVAAVGASGPQDRFVSNSMPVDCNNLTRAWIL